jgi:hypothetical protein
MVYNLIHRFIPLGNVKRSFLHTPVFTVKLLIPLYSVLKENSAKRKSRIDLCVVVEVYRPVHFGQRVVWLGTGGRKEKKKNCMTSF